MKPSEAVIEYAGLIRYLANAYSTRGMDVDDLVQDAGVAVLEMSGPITKRTVSDAIRNRLRTITRRHVDERDLTASLDSITGLDDDGESLTLHDFLGKPPLHESRVVSARAAQAVDTAVQVGKEMASSRGQTSRYDEILSMRAEGRSYTEIGEALGISKQAVRQAWLRAQKNIDRREVA